MERLTFLHGTTDANKELCTTQKNDLCSLLFVVVLIKIFKISLSFQAKCVIFILFYFSKSLLDCQEEEARADR